jgi:hypothetical protein
MKCNKWFKIYNVRTVYLVYSSKFWCALESIFISTINFLISVQNNKSYFLGSWDGELCRRDGRWRVHGQLQLHIKCLTLLHTGGEELLPNIKRSALLHTAGEELLLYIKWSALINTAPLHIKCLTLLNTAREEQLMHIKFNPVTHNRIRTTTTHKMLNLVSEEEP